MAGIALREADTRVLASPDGLPPGTRRNLTEAWTLTAFSMARFHTPRPRRSVVPLHCPKEKQRIMASFMLFHFSASY